MGYLKLKNYAELIELKEPAEESMNGLGYWYLRLALNKNFSAEEINAIFIPENLAELKIIDELGQEAILLNYTIIVNLKKVYDVADNTKNWLNMTLQKAIEEVK